MIKILQIIVLKKTSNVYVLYPFLIYVLEYNSKNVSMLNVKRLDLYLVESIPVKYTNSTVYIESFSRRDF